MLFCTDARYIMIPENSPDFYPPFPGLEG